MSPHSEPSRPAPPRRSGVVVPSRPRWHGRIAARLLHAFFSGLSATIRWSWTDPERHLSNAWPEPVIFAIWHNRLALSLSIHRKAFANHKPRRRMAGLVSASSDGGILAHAMHLFGVVPIRGSSSRRGPQALRELTTAARQGLDLAITPDGPRGPRYHVQDGVILTAQLTGLKIIPVSYKLGWKWSLKSWDAFQIPLPFSRCEVVLGPALHVPREASPEERETLRRELEQHLHRITRD